jgi:hypothetical protein
MTWQFRNKQDLIIEVWEKLDCESVGAREVEAIETVVADRYGEAAVDPPMVIARLLADEGAELRHSEIMELHVTRAADRPYDAALRGVVKLDDLNATLRTIKDLENLRKKFAAENDKNGLRLLRETAIRGKNDAIAVASHKSVDALDRQINDEIANWLTIWLQTPEAFGNWVGLRQRSRDFTDKFGHLRKD